MFSTSSNNKIFNRIWPILFIIIVWFIFAHPYFLKGKVPYPSTYQVNNYAPWNSYEKFWGPVKNGAMPDIITQIYPWRYFTIESWKNGYIPFWNPFSFSGTPHLANYQSAVFSPINILFFILPFVDAWSILVLLQPLLSGIFMYLFVRSLKVSLIGSLISSISFMFCGFITTWMGYGTLSLAISLLPLALFAIEKFYETRQLRYLGILGVSIPLSFFSGHFQTSLYFLIFIFLYIAFKYFNILLQISPSRSPSPLRQSFAGQVGHLEGVSTRNILNTRLPSVRAFSPRPAGKAFYLLLYALFGLLLSMPQILPSIEFYSQSVRSEVFQKGEVIPWSYLPTLLAPDFFGNPVTRNNWLGHYAEWNSYIGVLPLLLALYAIFRKRIASALFFLIISLVSLSLAFDTPLLELLINLHIPVLSTSAASRVIVLFSFSMAILAGFGFDRLLDDIKKRETKKIVAWFLICSILFLALWLIIVFKLFMPIDKILVARSNLILPTALFATGSTAILISLFQKKFTLFAICFLIFTISFDMLRFVTKWMPFDPKELVFTNISVTKYFSKISGHDRALGNYEAGVGVYYHLPSLEGYDPLYIGRYGEFITSFSDGKVRPSYRSVVSFPKDGIYTASALDVLGVKYIVHKKGDDGVGWTFPYWKYASDQFKLIFEDEKYRIFENKNVFPRAFLVGKYKVIRSKQEIIDTMFGGNFDLKKEVVLEENPLYSSSEVSPKADVVEKSTQDSSRPIRESQGGQDRTINIVGSGLGSVKITNYQPNFVELKTISDSDSILILTDNLYPGWKGFVDDREVPVYKANYTFRALVVPKGEHKVEFRYDSWGFRLGVYFAGLGVFSILVVLFSRGVKGNTPRRWCDKKF